MPSASIASSPMACPSRTELPWETAGPADSKSRVAIVSAFSPELTLLLGKTQIERKVTINGIEFTLGKLAGKDLVLFLSGESMVNASSNTQLLLDRSNVKAIVFSGIAGGRAVRF